MTPSRCLILFVLVLAGCSRASQPADSDSDRAREVLITALDAWKQGQAEKLSVSDPPIRFVDDDWAERTQLTEYEFEKPDAAIRPFESVRVNLVLRDRQGKSIRKSAAYQVSVTPTLAVLRSDP